jgi:type III secretion system low calcium response chaperone LcrH/SycD
MTTQADSIPQEELQELVETFFETGATFKDLRGLTDETMEAIYSVAYNLYQNGKFEDALKIFQFLCFYDHYNKKYYMGLGACRQMLKQYAEAIDTFTYASILDSSDPTPPLYAADCHLALGNLEAAESGFYAAHEWSGTKEEYKEIKERAKSMLDLIQKKTEEA